MQNNEVTLPECWRIIKKRRRIILFAFVVTFCSTIIFTKMQTPVYKSMIEVKVERKQTEPSLLGLWGDVPNLSTEIKIIKSLSILKKSVERVEVLPAEGEEREYMLHTLALEYQNKIDVKQIEETDLIRISTFHNSPSKVALFANAVADAYISENIQGRKKRGNNVLEYTENQLAELKGKIKEEEFELQHFKQNERVFVVTPAIKTILDRMTVKNTFEFENEMLLIQSEIESVSEALTEKGENPVVNLLLEDNPAENFIFTGLKRRLLELEFERFLLLIDYTVQHPAVARKDEVIGETKQQIVQIAKKFSPTPLTIEDEETFALALQRIFLTTRREVLYRIINKFYGDASSLSPNQVKYQELQRNVDRMLAAYNRLLDKKQDTELAIAGEVANISIISPAPVPRQPIKPVEKVNYLVGAVMGLFLGFVLAFVMESMDTSFGTIEDVERLFKYPILGIIPRIFADGTLLKSKEYEGSKGRELKLQREKLVSIFPERGQEEESFKALRTNLIQWMTKDNKKVILITSADQKEGKTTIAMNLAFSFAQLGRKTVLIDGNLRRPTIHNVLGLERGPGLADVLLGKLTWQEVVKTSTDILMGGMDIDYLLRISGLDNLRIITSGQPVKHVSEILNSPRTDRLFTQLKDECDVVLVDCSPALSVSDAMTVSNKVDGVVLVYKVGATNKEMLKRVCVHLTNVQANILGLILNAIKTEAQIGSSVYHYQDEEEKEENRWRKILNYVKDNFMDKFS